MKVPLLDLQPQMSRLRNEILQAMTDVLDSTQYILGPEVSSLEKSLAAYCGAPSAVGVSSGTDALLISLMALGIGPGDRVLTTPYTFFATMGSVIRVGAMPVFADILPDSMNIDPDHMAAILEEDRRKGGTIKAVIPVHLFGQCADMLRIRQITDDLRIPVIEDAAQAIGAEYPFRENGQTVWKKAGVMGTCGCFSFFPSKNLGGIGDGGLVTTTDESFAERLRVFRNHGAEPKYYHAHIGGNFRLDPIQACVLKIKLKHLEQWHQARRDNAAIYNRLFAEAGLAGKTVVLPTADYLSSEGAEGRNFHIYNQFVIRVSERDALRAFLTEQGVGCEVYYPLCLHQQDCLRPCGLTGQSFPRAEQAAGETLALPIYPELEPEQIEYVVGRIADFFSGRQ
ncbi:MAG TPA: DegT/DnrJ/EryC1/StrS family aminotransferase [Desulfobacteraceae bacterium]|nr:DegT/DnrJ/EryC1/StrS family aminotransferase [Desulfobacteraceae bacterium]